MDSGSDEGHATASGHTPLVHAPASGARGPLVITGTAAALSVGFLPLLYNRVQVYDDEGALLLGISEFVHRGSLYHHSSGYYGPFYYSLYGALFRILRTDPTPFTGRLTVLILTGLAAALFAATVYRLTRSVSAAVLCEVASFLTLIKVAGSEPMHPASLLVVLIALLAYCLASNSIRPRNSLLFFAGFATAATILTKINVGIFVVIALALWLVVGSRSVSLFIRVAVISGSAIFPLVLMNQKIWELWVATYAIVVAVSVLLLCVVAISGSPRPPTFRVKPFAIGAAATAFISVLWPFAHGTSPGYLLTGILIRPLNQAHALTVPAVIKASWPFLIIAAVAVALGAFWRDPEVAGHPIRDEHWAFVVGVAGLAVLGLGTFGTFLAWLPAVVVLPALTHFIKTERVASSILTLTVAVAILQSLHAFPVAGSQLGWSTVSMFLPCSIAVGVGLRHLAAWSRLAVTIRATATVAACAFLIVAAGYWPFGIWHDYLADPALALPGASLVRPDPDQSQVGTDALQSVTSFLVQHCDTFYSAPPTDTLYIYTKIPSPTGLTVSNYGIYNTAEQTEIANALEAAVQNGKRVCIVRESTGYDQWLASSTGQGPLGREVLSFSRLIGSIGSYTLYAKP